MSNFRQCLLAVSVVGALAVAAPTAFAQITFASGADYDNAASQMTGVFRDFLDGAFINQGLDLGGTGHTALNFTGADNTTAPFGRVTLYDTTPSTLAPTTFTGDMSLSADILISPFNNAKGGGLLTLFNEGGSSTGLALFLSEGGGSGDNYAMRLVQQNGVQSTNLSNVPVAGLIARNEWYRLTLDLDLTGSNFAITGTVFSHTLGTDPNSALLAQIGSTLTHSGSLGSGLSDPYEIGLVARAINAENGTSITNFSVTTAIPEPETYAMILAGLGLLGFVARRRRRNDAAA